MEREQNGRFNWGHRINLESLDELYAPREVEPYTVPRAGVDNLSLSSVDTFLMRDGGAFQVEFAGYFRVARAEPTTDDWSTAEVYVNLADMRLAGESEQLGPINVRINPDVVSAGQTFPPGLPRVAAAGSTAKCRIAAGVTFEAPDAGVTLYNAEPILLMNDAIEAIPPLEDPNGAAHVYMLPLFAHPDSARAAELDLNLPMAYLTGLRYTVGSYLSREEAESIRRS